MNSKDTIRKNDYCRKLRIRNYRNLGITDYAYMTLNRSLDSDRMGGLITLIGPNDSGKSNVLSAIDSVTGDPEVWDYPDFLDDYGEQTPEVDLVYYDGKEVEDSFNQLEPLKIHSDFSLIKDRDLCTVMLSDAIKYLHEQEKIELEESRQSTTKKKSGTYYLGSPAKINEPVSEPTPLDNYLKIVSDPNSTESDWSLVWDYFISLPWCDIMDSAVYSHSVNIAELSKCIIGSIY